jgi:replicative DNA helicase
MDKELYSLSVEKAVLNSLLFDPLQFETVDLTALKSEDFYLPAHQSIFKAMQELYFSDAPIDEMFIKKRLEKEGTYEESPFLEVLAASPISNLPAYIEELQEKSKKRSLVKLSSKIQSSIVEKDIDSLEVIDTLESELFALSQTTQKSDFREALEIVNSTRTLVKERMERDGDELIGVDTGFTQLNEMTTGFGEGDLIIVGARPAMGKCLGKGTKVVMFDGTLKSVEDVQVGDQLMGDDSTPRNVLSLARGQENMYWVRQNKGIDYRVNESHILSLKRSRNEGKHQHGDILNIPVHEYVQKSDKFKSNYKGYKVAIEFEAQTVEVEPYFLGLWLGDGHSRSVRITTVDHEVISYLHNYAANIDLYVTEEEQEGKTPTYAITSQQRGGKHDALQKKLRALNLLENKHIPYSYIANSSKNRLELLAGLIDSDGYYDDEFHVFEIVQKDEALAKQIKYLADSLGFRVSFKKKKASIKSIGYESDVYRLRIVGHLDQVPTKIARKQARPLQSKRDHQHTGITVELDKKDDYYGFTLDGNHLFLLEDMTVTHNTAFALNIVDTLIKKGDGVAFFSLEMPAEQLMLRILSMRASVPLQNIRKGNLDDDQQRRVEDSLAKIAKEPLYVDDQGSVNINQLRSKLRKLVSKHSEIRLAVVDYLQIMSSSTSKDRHLEVSDISRGLKMLARELKIPIIALSQLNRSLESRNDKRPMLSDIRESGSIEQDADIILFVYRDDVYLFKEEKEREKQAKKEGKEFVSTYVEKPEEKAEIIIGKQRNGPTGHVNLVFQKRFTRFVDDKPKEIEITYETVDTSSAQMNIPDEQISMPIL